MPDRCQLCCGQVQLPRWHDALQRAVHEPPGRSQELRLVQQDVPGRVLQRSLHLAVRALRTLAGRTKEQSEVLHAVEQRSERLGGQRWTKDHGHDAFGTE